MSSTLQASVFMGKEYSEILRSIKNTGNSLTMKQMFDICEKLIAEQSDEISSWKHLSLIGDEEVISLSHAKALERYAFSASVQKFITPWKDEQDSPQCELSANLMLMFSISKRQARFLREDFHQEDGHSSDLDQKRSGILLMKANHKENGTESRN